MGGNYLWEDCEDWEEINKFIEEETEKRGLYLYHDHAPNSMNEYDWETMLGTRYFEAEKSRNSGETMFELRVYQNGNPKLFDKLLKVDIGIEYPAPQFSCKIDFDKAAFVKFLDSLKES